MIARQVPCRIWFSEYGEGAGFHVAIPSNLYEAEDQAVWDALDERCDGQDQEAFEAEWDKRERTARSGARRLTAAQAVEWLRSKHDEAVALAKKRFEEQVSKFLEAATECGADELAKEGRREAKLRQIERQLIEEDSGDGRRIAAVGCRIIANSKPPASSPGFLLRNLQVVAPDVAPELFRWAPLPENYIRL